MRFMSGIPYGYHLDLTLPDSTWILPVTIGFLFLLNNELAASGISKEAMQKAGKTRLKGKIETEYEETERYLQSITSLLTRVSNLELL